MTQFAEFDLPAELLEAITQSGYKELTPIQRETMPAILEGRDVLALAPTGSGKTAAFSLGLLKEIDLGLVQTQALVLCPTRELADQVAGQIRKLGSRLPNLKVSVLTGGMPLGPQIASLKVHDPHVVVGTPGRIQELLRKKILHIRSLKVLVLDEADRMLDMGFTDQVTDILSRTPPKKQTLMFSATMPEAAEHISNQYLNDPLKVDAQSEAQHADIRTHFYRVGESHKLQALAQVLHHKDPQACVVFCNTRKMCDDVQHYLDQVGFSALALHGDFEQRDRDEVLLQFANESANVLVATDVAARGIDITHIDLVINYDVPFEPESYVHRIGRTGRAGAKGDAITLVTEVDGGRVQNIEDHLGTAVKPEVLRVTMKPTGVKHYAPMQTIRIDGGKTDKLRPGDLLGTLTGEGGLSANAIGKINIMPTKSYVAIKRGQVQDALNYLRNGKIKGKRFRAGLLK